LRLVLFKLAATLLYLSLFMSSCAPRNLVRLSSTICMFFMLLCIKIKMARTEAQVAAFDKCLAARKAALLAKAKAAEEQVKQEPEIKPVIEVPMVAEPVVEEVKQSLPLPVPASSPCAECSDDDDLELLDPSEILELIHNTTGELHDLREEMNELKNGHKNLHENMQRAELIKRHTINFV
jgi:hypothetical protein